MIKGKDQECENTEMFCGNNSAAYGPSYIKYRPQCYSSRSGAGMPAVPRTADFLMIFVVMYAFALAKP